MVDKEEFENLNAEQQAKVFRQSSLREKGELFPRCHDPERIARSLTGEEFYLIAKEMDREEKTEILQFATLPQLFFLSDIECWRHDRLSGSGFLGWLETLYEADEKKLLAWLLHMDYETVVSGLKQVMQVMKPEWEYATDESLGDMPSSTLDQFYHIYVKEESFETVRRVLEVLFENHRGRYTALLEGVLGEIDDEVEEEAFLKRGQRFEEHGFPDPETARKVFHPISKEEFENFSRKTPENFQKTGRKTGEPKLSLISFEAGKEKLFLDDVLLMVRENDSVSADGIGEELVWLSNKIIAAGGIDVVAEERLRRGVEQTRRLLNLGLEIVSGKNIHIATRFAQERWLETIFRLAVTRLYEIRSSAESIAEKYWKNEPKRLLEFLDPPYEMIFRGIFSAIPQFFDQSLPESQDQTRDFESLEDISRVMRSVEQIALIHQFLKDKMPSGFDELSRGKQLRLFEVLATGYASFVLNGTMSSRALSESQFLKFMEKGFEIKNGERVLDPRIKKAFSDHFFSPQEQELLRTLWVLVFQDIESELGRLKVGKKLDPRFVSVLRIHYSRGEI
ncbi:MAG: hypothetical protein HYZ83_04505 [Candidatus Omnitrophica bacterium]|nr:hypothetical protein [Candidatus Omnitrophota bacterium]